MIKMHDLSGLEINIILKEFNQLIGSYIDKFYEIDKDVFRLKLSKEKNKINIGCILPNRINITSFIIKKETVTNFAIAVRKQINNYIINNIYQLNNDRIIVFNLKNKITEKNLIFEMFGKGNLIITDKLMNILLSYKIHDFRDRQIRPGKIYVKPKNNFLGSDLNKIEKIINDLEINLRENLTIKGFNNKLISLLSKYLNFGPLYLEDALLKENLDPKDQMSKPDKEKITKIIFALNKEFKNPKIQYLLYLDNNQIIDYSIFEIKKYQNLTKKIFNSFSSLLDFLSESEIKFINSTSTQTDKQIKEILETENSIKKQHKLFKDNLEQMEINRHNGEIIFKNMTIINIIINELKKNQKISINELENMFQDIKIINIDLKLKKILIELN